MSTVPPPEGPHYYSDRTVLLGTVVIITLFILFILYARVPH